MIAKTIRLAVVLDKADLGTRQSAAGRVLPTALPRHRRSHSSVVASPPGGQLRAALSERGDSDAAV